MPREELYGLIKSMYNESRMPGVGVVGTVGAWTLDSINKCASTIVACVTVLVLIPSAIKGWKWVFDTYIFKKKPTTEE